jgi:hypothetical protein
MQIDRPGRDSERGPAEQFTGNVWTDVIAAPSQSSPVAVYSVHFAPDGIGTVQGQRRS